MPSKDAAQFSDRVSLQSTQKTLQALREIGGGVVTEESGIAYHEGKQILLPRGMTFKAAAKLTQQMAISMEEMHDFEKEFRYRPADGAYALQETLKELFGISGRGKAIHTMFGTEPPRYVNVEVGIGEEVRVPWGHIDFPPFRGTFMTGQIDDPKYGPLFRVVCRAPKEFEPEIEGLWLAVEDTLRRKSIYKGKAIVGVGRMTRAGFEAPAFMNPYAVDPDHVAYRQEVFDRLRASVWGPIQTAEMQRAEGMKLGRKTLLYGKYGTGKSLAGGLTARVAVDEGWTFIQTKVGDEDLSKVLAMAELYAPSVVFVEDVDTLLEHDPKEMAKLLELFDGVSSKNSEVMVLMTSNHAKSLSKGMTRVGRIDAAIEIGDLDNEGIRRLIMANFKVEQLDDSIDFEEIMEAMRGFEPAFIMGTFNLTKSNAIIRTKGRDFQVSTEDFVLAAKTLRNQHDTHTQALDRPVVDTFGTTLSTLVEESVQRVLPQYQVALGAQGELVELTD